jgi:hypothetical protein
MGNSETFLFFVVLICSVFRQKKTDSFGKRSNFVSKTQQVSYENGGKSI